VGAESVQQFVGGRLEAGPAQSLNVLVKAEEPAGPVAGFQQPVGEEEQPVPGTHRVRRQVQVWVHAQRCRERPRDQRFQLVSVVQPHRRRMPADHQLEPAPRVEFGEYRGDEIFLARRSRHGEVDCPGHFLQ